MRSAPAAVISALLLLLLTVQIGIKSLASKSELEMPATMRTLPDFQVRQVHGTGQTSFYALAENSPCTIIVFASVSCSFCKRMRFTWRDDFSSLRDSTSLPIRSAWISPEKSDSIAVFFERVDFGDTEILQFASDPNRLTDRFGVRATPAVYLLDRNRRLRYGIYGPRLPPADSVKAACS